MPLGNEQLGKILTEMSYVSEKELETALTTAEQHEAPLKDVLMDMGILTEALYESALAEYYKLPFADLPSNPPGPEMVELLPEDIARAFTMVVSKREKDGITVVTSDPSTPLLDDAIRLNFGQRIPEFPHDKNEKSSAFLGLFNFGRGRSRYGGKITLMYAPKSVIEALFVHYRKPLATRFQAIINKQKKVAPEIISEIFNDAIELRSSDIHFEPQEKIVIVRFRVDGIMHEAGRIPKEFYEGIVNRIKIEGNMQIDEHYAAQDGAIRYTTPRGLALDMRVSIVPIIDGEKIVVRLLSEYVRTLTLADLGISGEHQAALEKIAYKPFGMILTTGPTGAGKSTTLYALLKLRNHPDVNISTIEDPVEYKVPGINHIQVNTETNLTFANGLRALVRQDPNIILVGEIRDGETASISINAALTGHLMFSTLHANDAATAIPRLLDMGAEPFLVASTLEVVIAQRLVRRICPQCRYSYSISRTDAYKLFPGAEEYFLEDNVLLYQGKGCESCGETGFRGRIGIFELLFITSEIKNLIIARSSSADLNAMAYKQGMKFMFDDGFVKVRQGMTTVDELIRVAAPPAILLSEGKNTAANETKTQKPDPSVRAVL